MDTVESTSPLSFLQQLVQPHKISDGEKLRSERLNKFIQAQKDGQTAQKSGFTFDVTADHPMTKVKTHQIGGGGDNSPREEKQFFIVHSEFIEKAPTLNRMKQTNGLVNTIATAYNEHHHLILRPDDIWLAMLVQFSKHVEQNAAKLRDSIVKFNQNDLDGKKKLIVHGEGNLYTTQYDKLCTMMTNEIAKHIVDPSIREWIIPEFSTTTDKDRVCGAITMMSSMKCYFNYEFRLRCGLPRVTLEGTVEDWQELRRLANRFLEFETDDHHHMQQWHSLYTPVLDEFVKSASGRPDIEFWKLVVHYKGNGSGPRYLSGWVTVFCPFDDKGAWMCDLTKQQRVSYRFQYIREEVNDAEEDDTYSRWPIIDTNRIPSGSCCVDVIVDDNGTVYNCELVAGQSRHTNPAQCRVVIVVEELNNISLFIIKTQSINTCVNQITIGF